MSEHVDTSLPLEYQTEEDRLKIFGFWVLLAAEITLFATLFGTYFTLHHQVANGPTQHELFELKGVMIETILLLVSSFTCGLAVFSMRNGKKNALLFWFIITLLLGAGFIFFEVTEFVSYVHDGATIQTSAFLSAFFVLLGTHGGHVSFGILWGIGLIIQLLTRGLTHSTARKFFIISIYWHFLDVIWIFIFTFVYLGGMIK
ncbi:cytochrome aa3 quinol oxidase subunit III [Heyndrickxia ginsengihumi]|uniref:Quinol oxidase subunit 3 n=1 Tax=Heyndrickxia ginsengihumi TaxID=363870 RepID=A0A0A6XW75_9BACI|nr:cytochrome aa3 quinol oxidase subunit III [Heyndrickxia ginsengihumi]KHD84382.1 cytochrome o ubiquinol oxidase subunit III [Heyndrickxia ginsengihumi]MCM3024743.1 cytochrome aa3 quinol oxidase subunit III [Heyndrickxia ginsengihumi]NEY19437.1 cytochrome aa3 quinol oxidase subunit III [Heyndrickxia ginsengihumi]